MVEPDVNDEDVHEIPAAAEEVHVQVQVGFNAQHFFRSNNPHLFRCSRGGFKNQGE